MGIPKIHLLYYKNILDRVFVSFFEDHNDYFTKNGDRYILSSDFTYFHLHKIFREYIVSEIRKYITPFNDDDRNVFLIIGACSPRNNLLLRFKKNDYFPAKLDRIIHSDFPVKYHLREKDIVLNNIRFNEVLINIFNEFYLERKNVYECFGHEFRNLFFIQHRNLDCYAMYKTIKQIYGRNNCINIHKEMFKDKTEHLIAVNELIDKYINNKKELVHSSEFSEARDEMKATIDLLFRDLENDNG